MTCTDSSVSLFENLKIAHRGNFFEGYRCLLSSFPRKKVIQHERMYSPWNPSLHTHIVKEVNFSLKCPIVTQFQPHKNQKGILWYFRTPVTISPRQYYKTSHKQKNNTLCLHSTFLLKSSADIISLILTGFLRFADGGIAHNEVKCLRPLEELASSELGKKTWFPDWD